MIWLIGSRGMLGRELDLSLSSCGLVFTGTDREVDITKTEALLAFAEAQSQSINWIINCAAYTAVDKAEHDREHCRLLNTDGPGNIASVARKIGATLIHISTDYVFNGQGKRPYTEEDPTDPIGVYALSKRDGEEKALAEHASTYIIRTAWLYGKYGNNFVHTMLALMKEREDVTVVNDQRGSPTWARDLAEALIKLIHAGNEGKTAPYGVYHYTNEAEISWFDFAREIHKQGRSLGILTRDCEIIPCASTNFERAVKRPVYSVLDKTKIKDILKISIPIWDASLSKFLSEFTWG